MCTNLIFHVLAPFFDTIFEFFGSNLTKLIGCIVLRFALVGYKVNVFKGLSVSFEDKYDWIRYTITDRLGTKKSYLFSLINFCYKISF